MRMFRWVRGLLGLDVDHIDDRRLCCGTPPDCEWKAQAGNICVASFDWSCSGICRSADRMKEVHRRCGEEQMPYTVDFSILVKERDRKIGRKRLEAVDRATVLRYIGEPICNDGQSS
ncbi:hypothetical protein OIU84_016691 [Salix udensis]|uniref:Uncharacterized protein n=1 Tax=Salix udensis TaxID=889485 RepID=A0AAD6JA11_9ROSI|nr:hypothetical protein OIU84_016691 [Salix udensis]